jgi:predicted nucleotidyltransferase
MIADDVRRFLEQRKAAYCLIGGHAVAARGYPRFTVDYDFLTTDRSVLKHDAWTDFDAEVDPRKGDYDDPLYGVVHITGRDGSEVDIVVAKWKWELEVIQRAERLDLGVMQVPVPRTGDLILLKLAAGGFHDLNDIQVLLSVGDRATIVAEVNEHISKLQADAQAAWRRLTSTATSG